MLGREESMVDADHQKILAGKSETDRLEIAHRVSAHLSNDDISDADRRAAEMIAYELAQDAVERVRRGLSKAVRHAKHLPRDLALKIAHDVDSVACPFLEVTEVFSDSDWQQLLLTVSRGGQIAIARRASMTEEIAGGLSELGESFVAEEMIENPASPMTGPVCNTLMDRFASQAWVLDKLAQREDLIAEIALKLTTRVSAAAREKLASTYNLPDFTGPIVAEAETEAVLQIVRRTPEEALIAFAKTLRNQGKLKPLLLMAALHDEQVEFVEVALSVLSDQSLEHVRSVMRRAEQETVTGLLKKARFPDVMHDEFWKQLEVIRKN